RIVDSIDRGFLDLSGREVLERSEITPELKLAEHAQLWHLMGTLTSSGVPILDNFKLLRNCTRSPVLKDWLSTATEHIRSGGCVAEAMRLFPEEFTEQEISAVAAGEDQGELDRMLLELAGWLSSAPSGELPKSEPPADENVTSDEVSPILSMNEEDIEELANKMPVVKLLNLVILQAIKDNATDIHFETYEDRFTIRYRVDGTLYEMMPPPRHLAVAILSRIKIMARLDIAEKRLPQEGRIELKVSGERIDLRVSTVPTVTGEHSSIRVLRPQQALIGLEALSLSEEHLGTMRSWMHSPTGLVIVSGPAGAGKTTMLYSLMNELKQTPARRVVSVENPVEYTISGVAQIQTNERIGFGMSRAIRAVMRQDPDIVMLSQLDSGSIVEQACKVAHSGHLVLAGMIAADAAGTIAGMLEFGSEPPLLASTLFGVSCQRLVRKLCECKQEVAVSQLPAAERDALGESAHEKYFIPAGCDKCMKVGYRGRMGTYEFLEVTEELRDAIVRRSPVGTLKEIANGQGFKSIRNDGLAKAAAGDTSVAEVIRVTAAPTPG
ncbi:MAG: ATPase, T2SS/T4P/T4SS family, partial [Planctomycetota bacterium]|nr:ATPase, T2SS/T4P/T4SS family [Planctomycetota bacterium]